MPSRRKPERSIGIDLGTSFCCVGTWHNGTVEIIPNHMGERTTPSFVAFTDTEILIGTAAKNQAARNPLNTICDIMRLIGRKYNDISMASDMKLWPFKIVRESNDRIVIEVEYKSERKRYFPEEILSMIIVYMTQIAQDYIGTDINNLVISVPTKFISISQIQCIKTAATIAGLNVLRIKASPTSAGITYGLNHDDDDEQNVLIFDLGGSAFEVSLLSIDDNVFEVKAMAIDTHLGGQDFDNILVDYFVKEFKRKNKTDCTKSKRAMRRLRTQCERAKRILSAATRADIEIDSLYDGIDFASSITRERFEDLCMYYFRQCLEPVTKVLQDAKMSKSEINEVVLVGGSTRIPRIQQMIKQYFNGKEPNKSVNPDEAAAFGASVQAAILSGDEMGDAGDLLVLEVTPLSLGVETAGGVMTKLIERNKNIPCKANETFTTYGDTIPTNNDNKENKKEDIRLSALKLPRSLDDESTVLIKIYEGETQFTKNNTLLGILELTKVPRIPHGASQIEVTFDLDAHSVFSITAKDKRNPTNSNKIIVNDKPRFSEAEMNKMVDEAKKYKAEHEEKMKTIQAKNELENFAYQMRNTLDDEKIQDAIKHTIDWIDGNPNAKREEFEAKKKELEGVWRPIITAAYGGMHGGLTNNEKKENMEQESLRLELEKQKDMNKEQNTLIQQFMEKNTSLKSEIRNLRNVNISQNGLIQSYMKQISGLQSENNILKNVLQLKDEELNKLQNDISPNDKREYDDDDDISMYLN